MILNDSIIRMRITVALTGMIIGSVMLRKICQRPAPSTSRGLFGLEVASLETRQEDDVHERDPLPHVADDDRDARAPRVAEDREVRHAGRREERARTGPPCVSVSIRNMYAMPTGVMVIGSRNTTRKNRWPASRWMVSIASPRPMRYCEAGARR